MWHRLSSTRAWAVLAVLVLAAGLASCGGREETETTTTADTAGTQTAGLTDANIAAIVVAANEIDAKHGELARDKATNPGVKQFAQQMITDHTTAGNQARDLAGRLNLGPEDNETSTQLKANADAVHDSLEDKSGADFDRSYIEHEVMMHQQVLDLLDNQLIPNAQNAELRTLLENTRPVIAAHLESARRLQTQLSR